MKPECLTAVAYLATRVTKCSVNDVDELHRVVRYIRWSGDSGLVFRPGGSGISVKLFVDASYGVHVDGKSHTGSCVVIEDIGAVHCRSTKQRIVSKSNTEAELIGLSDSANQGIHTRMFLDNQGYSMGPVTVYQDNMSCMALIDRGRSGAEKTGHIEIRYFWVKERVSTGELILSRIAYDIVCSFWQISEKTISKHFDGDIDSGNSMCPTIVPIAFDRHIEIDSIPDDETKIFIIYGTLGSSALHLGILSE